MATNGRPVTRINVNYGSLGTAAEARALSPVLIGPRFILHSYKDGYADGYLGVFDSYKNTLKDMPWPYVQERGTKVDVGSAQLFVEKPYIELNKEAIGGSAVSGSNEITLSEAVKGDEKSTKLDNFEVNVGDRVDITIEGSDTSSIVHAKVTGIGYTKTLASVNPAPTKIGSTSSNLVASGEFTGTADCDYLVKVVEVTSTGVLAQVSSVSGDPGYLETLEIGTSAISIGNYGMKLAIEADATYAVGDAWVARCTSVKDDAAKVIYVNDVLSVAEGDTVSCNFSSNRYSADFVEVRKGITATASTVSVSDNLTTSVGGSSCRIVEGAVYVDYREFVKEGALSLVSSRAAGMTEWAGVADPQNPLGLMAAVAGNVEGASFYLLATEGESVEDYIRAINYVAQFENAYALVPYSDDPKVRAAIVSVINKYAAPEIAQFKRGWVASSVNVKETIYAKDSEGSPILADINESGVVSITNGNVITGGVAPGDFVSVYGEYNPDTGMYDKAEYEIYKIVDDMTVMVYDAVKTTVSRIEFVRKRSNQEYAKAIAAEAAGINAIRINLVWGDGIGALGYSDLPKSIACVALAAQRSALPPHAPMTDLVVPGITTQDSLKFSDEEYQTMNNGGVWVICNNSDGETTTYHQVTTRTDGTIAEEDSCVSNGDAVIRYFRAAIKSICNGSANVYDGLLDIVRSQLVAQAEMIKVIQFPDMYGPLLIDFKVNRVYRPDSNKGAIMVDSDVELARPYAGGDFNFNLI